jgi:hypothetical protein
MAAVQYESKENTGRNSWTACYGRYVIGIDANRPGVYRWLISLEGRSVRKGLASDRDQADAAVSDALTSCLARCRRCVCR